MRPEGARGPHAGASAPRPVGPQPEKQVKGVKGGAAPRSRRLPGLGIPGDVGGTGSFCVVWGSCGRKLQRGGMIRGDAEGCSEATTPGGDSSGPLKRQGGCWKEVSFFRDRGGGEEERTGSRGRSMGRDHARMGVAGVRDSPPTSCSLGLRGRSGHRSGCQAAGGHGEVGGALRRAPAPIPRPCPVLDPLGASGAPLELRIGVFPRQSPPVGCG